MNTVLGRMPSLTSFSPVSPDHRKSPIAWSISINQITHCAEESVTHVWIGNCSIKWKLQLLIYSLLLISSCPRSQGKVGWRRIHSIAWVSKHSRECVLLVLFWTPAVLGNKSARPKKKKKKKILSWILFLINFFLICFWLHWVFVTVQIFSSCGAWASHCSGFSCWGARALGCMGFSSYGLWVP